MKTPSGQLVCHGDLISPLGKWIYRNLLSQCFVHGFWLGRSLVHFSERVSDSETATRVMSLILSEPISPCLSKGDTFIPAHPHYREAIRTKKIVCNSIHIWYDGKSFATVNRYSLLMLSAGCMWGTFLRAFSIFI